MRYISLLHSISQVIPTYSKTPYTSLVQLPTSVTPKLGSRHYRLPQYARSGHMKMEAAFSPTAAQIHWSPLILVVKSIWIAERRPRRLACLLLRVEWLLAGLNISRAGVFDRNKKRGLRDTVETDRWHDAWKRLHMQHRSLICGCIAQNFILARRSSHTWINKSYGSLAIEDIEIQLDQLERLTDAFTDRFHSWNENLTSISGIKISNSQAVLSAHRRGKMGELCKKADDWEYSPCPLPY